VCVFDRICVWPFGMCLKRPNIELTLSFFSSCDLFDASSKKNPFPVTEHNVWVLRIQTFSAITSKRWRRPLREKDHNLFRLQLSLTLLESERKRENSLLERGSVPAFSLVDSIMSSCVHTHTTNTWLGRPTGFVSVCLQSRDRTPNQTTNTSQHNSGVSRDFRQLPPLFGFWSFSFPVFALRRRRRWWWCDDGCCVSCVILDPQQCWKTGGPHPLKGVAVNRNKRDYFIAILLLLFSVYLRVRRRKSFTSPRAKSNLARASMRWHCNTLVCSLLCADRSPWSFNF